MQITRGRQNSPYKIVLYGVEGIGKSTFASKFPDPLFIDTEGSTTRMDVARLPKPTSAAMLAEMLEYVKREKPCKTLIIDTADWAEMLIIQDVCAAWKVDSIEKVDKGFGKGYTYTAESFGRFLNKLTEITNVGIHVVVTAHAWIKAFSPPDETNSYDRWQLKLTKLSYPILKEWADMILFANYKVTVVQNKEKKGKGYGGERVMYTTHHPAWDAKNRDGLPEELPFEFSSIAHIFSGQPAVNSTPVTSPAAKQDTFRDDPVKEVDKVTEPRAEATTQAVPEPTPVATASTEILEEYPEGLPQKVIDLLKMMNATGSILMQAIGPSTNGGLGYFPGDMAVASVPEAFWDHVAANWKAEFKPIVENILMDIPF